MATITVTKKSVSKPRNGMFSITLNLLIKNGEETLIDSDFTEVHKTEKTIDFTLGKFTKKMQEAIDFYKSEKAVFDSSQLDTAVSTLQNNLTY